MSMTIVKPSLQLLLFETAEPVLLDLPDAQGHQTSLPSVPDNILILPGSELPWIMDLVDVNYLKFNNVSILLNKPISFVHALLPAAVISKASVSLSTVLLNLIDRSG